VRGARVIRLCNSLLARLNTTLVSARGDEGQTFTEYAIIVAAVTTGTVAAVGSLRNAVITALTTVAGNI
jgi:Flp pilus assembly pilin Flp